MSTGTLSVTRALISVSDKTGVVEFARELVALGVEILSTGGTAKLLAENDIAVSEVVSKTEFPEIMGGRVKTLHPKIHGGILGRRGLDEQVMQEQGIDRIDMVVVNLYPFAETVAKPGCTLENAIENIDIGGPAMLRAAAKNHDAVVVITNPTDYEPIMLALRTSGGTSKATRFAFAVKAFTHTATYDGMISNYLSAVDEVQLTNTAEFEPALNEFPDELNLQFTKVQDMRYGENPHQVSSFYKAVPSSQADGQGGIANAHSIQGKALSYNNIADADAALDCVWQFEQPACVIVKHANPCGVALGDNVYDAYQAAYRCDPTSAFGGILAFNREVGGRCMAGMLEQQFVEVVLAPDFSDEALQALKAKPAVRALRTSPVGSGVADLRYQSVGGGLLVQSSDQLLLSDSGMSVVTQIAPTAEQERDLLFAWQVAKYVKSNAIVYADNQQTVGIGAGQMSRVYSARIAAIKAADEKLEVKGAVMASDAFFPFRDGIDSAAQVGISAVIQPGGSKNDQQVIDAANEQGLAMVFTGMRHFRH